MRIRALKLGEGVTEPRAVATGPELSTRPAQLNHRTICRSQWMLDSTRLALLNQTLTLTI